MASWKIVEDTSSAIDSRSSAWAGVLNGGSANSRGMTDHSFAITIGMTARPIVTCRPCVRPYSHDGCVGQSNSSGRSFVLSTIALSPRLGM